MIPGILGKKIGMTRIYDENGRIVPVTVVQAGPCPVLQVKTRETDGYEAVQIGFGDRRPARATRQAIGHAKKAGAQAQRFIREIRFDGAAESSVGDTVKVGDFSEAGIVWVDVVGTSKGFGFQGVMKRHGFKGQLASHGVERKHRSPGGIGANSGNRGLGRCIKKGKKMAGQMGAVPRTTRNLKLVGVDSDRNVLVISGAIPGPNGGYVLIRKSKTKGNKK